MSCATREVTSSSVILSEAKDLLPIHTGGLVETGDFAGIAAAHDATNHRVKTYFVYIMTNHAQTLYVGVTNDLRRRVYEHQHKLVPGFTARYNIERLVYFEHTADVRSAIERERQIKGWRRNRKIELIETVNRGWADLSDTMMIPAVDHASQLSS